MGLKSQYVGGNVKGWNKQGVLTAAASVDDFKRHRGSMDIQGPVLKNKYDTNLRAHMATFSPHNQSLPGGSRGATTKPGRYPSTMRP